LYHRKQGENVLFKKIGIVEAPLHFPGFGSPSSLFSTTFGALLDKVDTLPPLLMRRRFDPIGPGKISFPGIDISVAMVLLLLWWLLGCEGGGTGSLEKFK
jgi:hypothetical protein